MNPPGFKLTLNAITEEQSSVIVAAILQNPFMTDAGRSTQKFHDLTAHPRAHRRWFHPQSVEGMPAWTEELLPVIEGLGYASGRPHRLIVNRYAPAQVCAPHVDQVFSKLPTVVVVVSLLSTRTMVFRKLIGGDTARVDLPANSIAVMSGESRYAWDHAILAGVAERYSLIFSFLEKE